jgi:hypothetical protein
MGESNVVPSYFTPLMIAGKSLRRYDTRAIGDFYVGGRAKPKSSAVSRDCQIGGSSA